MYNQLLEQTEKAERLKQENQKLCQEVKHLGHELIAFTQSLQARIEAAVQKATQPLTEHIVEQEKIIKAQAEEIVRLKAIINKDSGNSSKPPSSNGFKKVITNSREPTGKRPGGQKGHPGRSLSKPENWEELKELGLAQVEDHTDGSRVYESRYVVDIDISVKWTEHRYPRGAKELQRMPPITYGERLQALAILLAEEEYVGQERVCEFIQAITEGKVHPSQGWLNGVIQRFSGRLDGELAKIEEDLLNGLVMHTDETPMKTTEWAEPGDGNEPAKLEKSSKTSEKAYMRVHSNTQTTLLTVNRHKDMEGVVQDGILPRFHGILSHDHDIKYYNYGSEHATCGEHLMRELKGIAASYGCVWPKEMRSFMNEMNEYKKADIAGKTIPPAGCPSKQFMVFSERYDALLELGAIAKEKTDNQYAKDELRKILERLRCYKNAYLLFMKNYSAPFTNNQAQRDLRPCKGKQKISGCFRSWAGIGAYARIRSFFSTVRKRKLNIMDALLNIIRGNPVLIRM
jgi:hypothetical protein